MVIVAGTASQQCIKLIRARSPTWGPLPHRRRNAGLLGLWRTICNYLQHNRHRKSQLPATTRHPGVVVERSEGAAGRIPPPVTDRGRDRSVTREGAQGGRGPNTHRPIDGSGARGRSTPERGGGDPGDRADPESERRPRHQSPAGGWPTSPASPSHPPAQPQRNPTQPNDAPPRLISVSLSLCCVVALEDAACTKEEGGGEKKKRGKGKHAPRLVGSGPILTKRATCVCAKGREQGREAK